VLSTQELNSDPAHDFLDCRTPGCIYCARDAAEICSGNFHSQDTEVAASNWREDTNIFGAQEEPPILQPISFIETQRWIDIREPFEETPVRGLRQQRLASFRPPPLSSFNLPNAIEDNLGVLTAAPGSVTNCQRGSRIDQLPAVPGASAQLPMPATSRVSQITAPSHTIPFGGFTALHHLTMHAPPTHGQGNFAPSGQEHDVINFNTSSNTSSNTNINTSITTNGHGDGVLRPIRGTLSILILSYLEYIQTRLSAVLFTVTVFFWQMYKTLQSQLVYRDHNYFLLLLASWWAVFVLK
jgi:hypothetical protein